MFFIYLAFIVTIIILFQILFVKISEKKNKKFFKIIIPILLCFGATYLTVFLVNFDIRVYSSKGLSISGIWKEAIYLFFLFNIPTFISIITTIIVKKYENKNDYNNK